MRPLAERDTLSPFPPFRILLDMEATIQHLGEVQFEVQLRGHRILVDQPESNGGYDEGPTPPELLLASLGSCAAYYAAEYLRTRQLPADGLSVRITAEKVKGPARLENFKIDIHLDAPLEERHREGILKAAKACLIHATLVHPPKIDVQVSAPSAKISVAA